MASAAFDAEAAKRAGVVCGATKDGRVAVSLSVSVVASRAKVAFCAVLAVLAAGYVVAPILGMQGMRARVLQLEHQMSRKLAWVLQHKEHIRAHLGGGGGGDVDGGGGGGARAADGRRHLLIDAGGVSRLAEALAPDTGVAAFDSHYLCGDRDVEESEVVHKTVALAAISWAAPLSLRNSMESWRAGGLLDIVDERMLFLNSPTEADRAIAAEYDFDVYTTQERNGNIMVGPALAYLVGNSSADYILLMEKDFVLSADRDTTMREMYTAVQHLARGVEVYRLRGKTDYPAEGMPDCCTPAEPPTCPYHSNWRSAGGFGDHMNWLLIWCDPDIMAHSNGRLVRCTREPDAPDSYCFTTGETNWSNNPVLFPRTWFNQRMRDVAFKDWERNNMFEFYAMLEWLAWQPPARVCVSWNGIFTHYEIDQ